MVTADSQHLAGGWVPAGFAARRGGVCCQQHKHGCVVVPLVKLEGEIQ